MHNSTRAQMNMRYDYYCSIRVFPDSSSVKNALVLSIHRCARHDRHAEWRIRCPR